MLTSFSGHRNWSIVCLLLRSEGGVVFQHTSLTWYFIYPDTTCVSIITHKVLHPLPLFCTSRNMLDSEAGSHVGVNWDLPICKRAEKRVILWSGVNCSELSVSLYTQRFSVPICDEVLGILFCCLGRCLAASKCAVDGSQHVTPSLYSSLSSPLGKDIESVWNHWVQLPCLLQTARPLHTSWAPGVSMIRSKHMDAWSGRRGRLFWAGQNPHLEPPCAGMTLEIPAFGSLGIFHSTPVKL